MAELLIVCSLNPVALNARRANLLGALWNRAAARDEIASGYRLRFVAEDDVLPLIAHVIDGERQCYRLLRFTVIIEPDGGPIWVELTGPPGSREFLAHLIEA